MAEDNNILDFYPESEEEACAEDSYVTLVDEDGNEVDMSVVDIVVLFPGSFRNRQYAYCIGHGAGNAGHLHSLYHLHYSDSATRRGHLLDLGNGLFQLYSHFLLAIYQTWELARKENLVSLH